MPIVNIVLNNRNFQLSCEDGFEEQLLNLADTVNLELEDLKTTNKMASFDLLLVMLTLGMQDKLQNMQLKLDKASRENPYSADDEKFAETLSTIAQYLDTLAQKISK